MKKTILAVFIAPIMLVGTAHAAFVESLDGNYENKLDFNGTIVNKAPNWEWEIPDATRLKAKDLELDVADAVKLEGGQLDWDLGTKGTYLLLNGRMRAVIATGQPGLTPEIVISGTKIGWDSPRDITVSAQASGTKAGAEVPSGALTFNATAGITALFDEDGGVTQALSGDGTTQEVERELLADLRAQREEALGTGPTKYTNYTAAQVADVFPSAGIHNLAGAATVGIKALHVVFPQATLPDTWQASVPVTVTLK